MNLLDYQVAAYKTALPSAKSVNYMAYGLASECGEVMGKLKKQIRDGTVAHEALAAEIGDVLWYVAGLSTELGLQLDTIAEKNLEKLKNRQKNGKLQGDGDTR